MMRKFDEVSYLNIVFSTIKDVMIIQIASLLKDPTSEEVSMNLIYKSSKGLLQEATKLRKCSKTLLEKFYSKRNKFKGKLICPVDVS